MYPIIFRFGPIAVYSYGVALAMAFIVATYLVRIEARKIGVLPEKIFDLAATILIFGLVGARIFYVATHFQDFKENLWEIIKLYHGGLSFYGGFFAGLLGGIWFIKRNKMDFREMVDLISPYLAVAQAIGRIGCLLRGCCYGKITQSIFAIRFPDEDVFRHPTQIYASFINVVLFLFLRKRYERRRFKGEIFLLYLVFYSLKRFFLDFLRAQTEPVFLNLSIWQWISVGVFFISLTVYLKFKNAQLKS